MYKHLHETPMASKLNKEVTDKQLKCSLTDIPSDLLEKDHTAGAKLVEGLAAVISWGKLAEGCMETDGDFFLNFRNKLE